MTALWSAWTEVHGEPAFTQLRAPEIGTVMVRGRAGAVGAPFNLGEITVTRASVQLASGVVGHGYVQGRSKTLALRVALIDALAEDGQGADIEASFIEPLERDRGGKRAARDKKAAKTKVEFFTMVRGEG